MQENWIPVAMTREACLCESGFAGRGNLGVEERDRQVAALQPRAEAGGKCASRGAPPSIALAMDGGRDDKKREIAAPLL